jgi:hypothetical protein
MLEEDSARTPALGRVAGVRAVQPCVARSGPCFDARILADVEHAVHVRRHRAVHLARGGLEQLEPATD